MPLAFGFGSVFLSRYFFFFFAWSRKVQAAAEEISLGLKPPSHAFDGCKPVCLLSVGIACSFFYPPIFPRLAPFLFSAGVATWTVAIPPDVIKSRWQTAAEGTYSGLGDVLR